jgi:hypothetical protein
MTDKVIEALKSIKDLPLFHDESVYLDENKPINLSFNDIKEEVLLAFSRYDT